MKQNKEISDLILEMQRRKVVFKPNTNEYLRYAFEYNCQLMERLGQNPIEDTNHLRLCIKAYIQKDLNEMNKYYYKHGRLDVLQVPSLEAIPKHIDYTLRNYKKEKKKVG